MLICQEVPEGETLHYVVVNDAYLWDWTGSTVMYSEFSASTTLTRSPFHFM